jgi:hypothetical protein
MVCPVLKEVNGSVFVLFYIIKQFAVVCGSGFAPAGSLCRVSEEMSTSQQL